MAGDKENRLRLFMDDLRALLWQHDAELTVELNNAGDYDHDSELRVYWKFGDSATLPRNIDGKEPTQ